MLVSNSLFSPSMHVQTGTTLNPEDIYHLHKQRVYRLCLRFCGGNTAVAEDITHDIFMKMLEHFDELEEMDSLEPWFYRVTTNACFSHFRREHSVWNKVRQALSHQLQPKPDTPEHQVQVREELQNTMRSLAQLPSKERIVFCMHALDECSQREIAEALGLSKGYVSKLLQQARQHIKKQGWSSDDV